MKMNYLPQNDLAQKAGQPASKRKMTLPQKKMTLP